MFRAYSIVGIAGIALLLANASPAQACRGWGYNSGCCYDSPYVVTQGYSYAAPSYYVAPSYASPSYSYAAPSCSGCGTYYYAAPSYSYYGWGGRGCRRWGRGW